MTNDSTSKANNTINELELWCRTQLSNIGVTGSYTMTPLSGDASFRQYFRLKGLHSSFIAVNAPPSTEKNDEFVAISDLFDKAGLTVPRVLGLEEEQGFILLTDLGDELLLNTLNADNVDHWYGQAMSLIHSIQNITAPSWCAEYSRAQMREDLQRFPEWYVEGLLAHTMSKEENELFEAFCQTLIDTALSQPQVLTHYDFQSRNLMIENEQLAVIDFQDAIVAPVTYDLASLLRDCYVAWPAEQVRAWAVGFAHTARKNNVITGDISDEQFLRWFNWMSIQRHVRVLGTFARLHLRDGKSGYLQDIPLVNQYVLDVAKQNADLREFASWFEKTIQPLAEQQAWYQS